MRTQTSCMIALLGLVAVGVGVPACSSYSETGGDPNTQVRHENTLHDEVLTTVDLFKQKDPSITRFFDNAYGVIVLPNVGKGGIGIGGAYGKGEVYENGVLIGYATLAQGTIGAQLGGQSYAQVIFLQTAPKLAVLKDGEYTFAAQASAVAATAGAAANADYAEGVAIFTMPRGGLMGEATVGGQKISFEPLMQRDRDHDVKIYLDENRARVRD